MKTVKLSLIAALFAASGIAFAADGTQAASQAAGGSGAAVSGYWGYSVAGAEQGSQGSSLAIAEDGHGNQADYTYTQSQQSGSGSAYGYSYDYWGSYSSGYSNGSGAAAYGWTN